MGLCWYLLQLAAQSPAGGLSLVVYPWSTAVPILGWKYYLVSSLMNWTMGPKKSWESSKLGSWYLDGWAAARRKMDNLQKWVHNNAMKFSNGKCPLPVPGEEQFQALLSWGSSNPNWAWCWATIANWLIVLEEGIGLDDVWRPLPALGVLWLYVFPTGQKKYFGHSRLKIIFCMYLLCPCLSCVQVVKKFLPLTLSLPIT